MKPGLIRSTTFALWILLCRVECVVFDSEPDDQTHTFETGSLLEVSFYLDCKVSHLGAYRKVSWFKNGVIISDGYHLRSDLDHLIDTDRYSVKEYGTLNRFGMAVNDITPSTAAFDNGLYQCAVTRMNDVVVTDGKSRTAEVMVYVTPSANYPVCTVTDMSGRDPPRIHRIWSVGAGEMLKMSCQSGPSTPDVNLFWSSDQQRVLQQFESVRENDTLTSEYFWEAQPNAGNVNTFTCTLQHAGLQSNRTCELFLNVEYAPEVTIEPTHVLITDTAELVSFTCDQDSNPPYTNVTWYYDGDVIGDDDHVRIRVLSLHTSRFSAKHNGNHTIACKVTNAIGTGSASAEVIVQIPPPRFTGLPENILSKKTTLVTPQHPLTQCESCQKTGKISGAAVFIGQPQLFVLSWVLCHVGIHF